jgi:hypothetical protein
VTFWVLLYLDNMLVSEAGDGLPPGPTALKIVERAAPPNRLIGLLEQLFGTQ